MEDTQVKIISEIKEITANAVAKKQDAAKLNFPNIVEKIKKAAAIGNSYCRIPASEMNEYDKYLLTSEGFSVALVDREKTKYEEYRNIGQYIPKDDKEWLIKW